MLPLEFVIALFTSYILYLILFLCNISDIIAAIVEKNPGRFRLNSAEVVQRRYFVQQTRDEIGGIKEKLQIMRGQDSDHSARKVNIYYLSSFNWIFN